MVIHYNINSTGEFQIVYMFGTLECLSTEYVLYTLVPISNFCEMLKPGNKEESFLHNSKVMLASFFSYAARYSGVFYSID